MVLRLLTYKTYSDIYIILYFVNTMSRCPVELHLTLLLSSIIPTVHTVPKQLIAWTEFNAQSSSIWAEYK